MPTLPYHMPLNRHTRPLPPAPPFFPAGSCVICNSSRAVAALSRYLRRPLTACAGHARYVKQKIVNASKIKGVSKFSDTLYIAGQVTEAQLAEAKAEGVKSVLNLRGMDEVGQLGLGVLPREKEIVEGLGLTYLNLPIPRSLKSTDKELVVSVREALDSLPKPVLLHCRSRGRVDIVLNAVVD